MAIANDPQIESRHVGKTYVSARTGRTVEALADIDLRAAARRVRGIVGPSGCGKSTLLSLVAGFADADDAAKCCSRARESTAPGPRARRDVPGLCVVPVAHRARQRRVRPVARGVAAGDSRRSARASYIAMVGLAGFEHRYPHELSGGMRQRCALARMLANDPKLWLMDEPLAAVDLQTRNILQDELLRLWGDERVRRRSRPAVMFVTHGIDEAVLLADRVIVLGRRPGRIKALVEVDVCHGRGRAAHVARGRTSGRANLEPDPRRGGAGDRRRDALSPQPRRTPRGGTQ